MELDRYMQRALDLSSKAVTHPNPTVGCVIVAGGSIVGEGVTSPAGRPHAEVTALQQAGGAAKGAAVFVSLEPHGFQSTSPPCTDALIAAGVAEVFIAITDPNPRVAGDGVRQLRKAGLNVEVGLGAKRAAKQLWAYTESYRLGRSVVTMKSAVTLDGSVAALDGTSQWITSAQAREDVHILRSKMHAVLVGAGTVRADNPLLDVRIDGYQGHQPHPVVVAGRSPLPSTAKIAERAPLVITTNAEVPWGQAIVVEPGPDGLPDLKAGLAALRSEGILSVLSEGGPTLNAALWSEGLIDKGVWYLAAKVGGGGGLPVLSGQFDTLSDATSITIEDVRMVGPDIRCEFKRSQ